MSDSRKTAPGAGVLNNRGKSLFLQFRDPLLILGWISALVLIAGLSWYFTQPVRSRLMLNSVNRVLQQNGDARRLERPLFPVGHNEHFGSLLMGSWFSLTDLSMGQVPAGASSAWQAREAKAYVFTYIAGGTIFPCAAIINPDGSVGELIPLNRHGEGVLKQLSPEILKIYFRRIEGLNQ